MTGVLLSIAAGPLGSFIIWRHMSYFGDTLAHASLLGISLGLLLNINPFFTIIVVTLLLTFILVLLEKNPEFTTDSMLGIIAHSSLSIGLVIISFMKNIRVELISYLFGDLLSVDYKDIIILLIGVLINSILLFFNWKSLLSVTINHELAFSDGINIQKNNLLLMLMIALTISISMKFVGALIITSLLIIPPSAARRFSNTPEQMSFIAILLGVISITTGLIFSAYYDTPVGPSVVICSTFLFIISLFIKT
ncbi:High-affinity zinc uptake system membrane protein ZnuB [Candidatus Providencia siddallii]|uniref:High-affinity zinc uptake system membrane protein ZnuB n=1 Tax=Candidatus Providencia siddallii TaxID=1715285 RepID=A0A0M6W8J8_9GAMM|nr:High-affinity zinc uptake system membrane protein ZnuB [Candidatus Providencia siddallii]